MVPDSSTCLTFARTQPGRDAERRKRTAQSAPLVPTEVGKLVDLLRTKMYSVLLVEDLPRVILGRVDCHQDLHKNLRCQRFGGLSCEPHAEPPPHLRLQRA